MRRKISIILIAILILALVGCGSSGNEDPGEAIYNPGKYTAVALGHNGNIEIEVEVSETRILSVKILVHEETAGVGDLAMEELADEIVEKQTTELDTITYATESSEALLKAVEDALEQAKL